MKKRTKIVCTIGPACENIEKITAMVKAGMNIARLNFSHGTYENHQMLIEHIRSVGKKTGEPIAVLQDLQGPKIRVGVLPGEGIELKEGDTVIFDTSIDSYKGAAIPVDYKELHTHVQSGERLLLNDGRTGTKIESVEGTRISAKVLNSGSITSHKGINIPDSHLSVSSLTEKDKKDARFGVEQKVDLMALSFVTSAKDILDLRYLIKEYEKECGIVSDQPIRIIAKIERGKAVQNILEILEVVDGIMVARGDLGIEIPAAEVPLTQKKLIDLALDHAKPVIVATQMLDSMQNNPRPTRAEVSDVANAVIDHADAVMLSNETATGKYPVETVQTMSEIIEKTEESAYDDLHPRENPHKKHSVDEVISRMSRMAAEDLGAKLILAASISGETGRLISRNRPEFPVVVATNSERTERQLNLSWGLAPFVLPPCRTIEELVERSMVYLKKHKQVKKGDKIIVVAGEPVGESGHVNVLEVREV
ncbi:MAG: pyruvate kinase [Candidatus Magasanikbacteria bacterium]|nr:pyruvate kinase [Candidatus Magasanikbacteria bacterium]